MYKRQDVWAPFTNIDEEKSIATDLVSLALDRIDVNSINKIVDFKEVVSNIETQKFDGSAALWIDDEREKTMLFSEPYLQNQLVLIGLKGANVAITSIKELTDKKIGIIKGYSYDDSLMTANNLELVFSENDQENLEKLLNEDIDYMLVDDLLIQYMLKYQVNDVNNYLSIASTPFETKSLHFALNKKTPNAKEIMSQFNAEIKAMVKDGSYNEVLGLNWIEADVNNDGIPELVLIGDSAGLELSLIHI